MVTAGSAEASPTTARTAPISAAAVRRFMCGRLPGLAVLVLGGVRLRGLVLAA